MSSDFVINCWWFVQLKNVTNGVVLGESIDQEGYWQSINANSINIVNMGGNIETTELYAPPLNITIAGLPCNLTKVLISSWLYLKLAWVPSNILPGLFWLSGCLAASF